MWLILGLAIAVGVGLAVAAVYEDKQHKQNLEDMANLMRELDTP